ncbi:MAG: CDC27 family protein [Bacteroidota bacterium]
MKEGSFIRAQLLYEQSRYSECLSLCKTELQTDPNNIAALIFIAKCQLHLDNLEEADRVSADLIGLAPVNEEVIFTRAQVLLQMKKATEAIKLLDGGIAFDPSRSNLFGLKAEALIRLKKPKLALDAANEGLRMDPENLLCLNVRAEAQMDLGEARSAKETLKGALEEDPENDATLANFGMQCLRRGEHKEAMNLFKEALSINPQNPIAQFGMQEALKARFFPYRLWLKYVFWISKLQQGRQALFIFGGYLIYRFLFKIAQDNPWIAPFIWPVIILYILFAISSWLIQPISNLLLFTHPFGKYLLSRNERLASIFVGILIGIALICGLFYMISSNGTLAFVGIASFLYAIPIGSSLSLDKKEGRNKILIFTGSIGAMGLLAIANEILRGGMMNIFSTLFFLGIFAYQFVFNFLVMKKSNYH